MLDKDTITTIADDLAAAEDSRSMIPLLTARYPEMTVEDSYKTCGGIARLLQAAAWSAERSA